MPEDRALIIAHACDALSGGSVDAAFEIIERDYPFSPLKPTKRSYGPPEMLKVFMRDGFIDRYCFKSSSSALIRSMREIVKGRLRLR